MSEKATARDWIVGILAIGFFPSLLAFGILLWVFPCMIKQNRPCVEKHLGPHAAEYAAMANLPEELGEGYVAGKLVVVNIGELVLARRGIEYKPNELNPDLHFLASDGAYTPQDVGTVILLRWGTVRDGTYEKGLIGYRVTCEVLVIDKQRQVVVAKKGFEGSLSPDRLHYSSRFGIRQEWRTYGVYGSFPSSEVSDYIAGLPRC